MRKAGFPEQVAERADRAFAPVEAAGGAVKEFRNIVRAVKAARGDADVAAAGSKGAADVQEPLEGVFDEFHFMRRSVGDAAGDRKTMYALVCITRKQRTNWMC